MLTLAWCLALGTLFGQAETALGQGRAYVAPKHFVLTKRDVPATFRQVGAGSLTDAEADRADHLPPGTFERHGRISSYETSFRYSGRQVATVQDNVIAFKSAAGAHWQFLRSLEQGRKPTSGQYFRVLNVKHIGNETAGFIYRVMVSASPVTCGIVIFRRGVYAAWVVTCGFAFTYINSASPALARIIDRRIQLAAPAVPGRLHLDAIVAAEVS
jgi:hypothetical protein